MLVRATSAPGPPFDTAASEPGSGREVAIKCSDRESNGEPARSGSLLRHASPRLLQFVVATRRRRLVRNIACVVHCNRYNAINGKPSCANDWLLQTVARDNWGFDG